MGSDAPRTDSDSRPSSTWVSSIRGHGWTLVLVPLVVLWFGGQWSWQRSMAPQKVLLVEPSDGPDQVDQIREVRLHFYDEGGDPGRGVSLSPGAYLDVELPRGVDRFQIVIQVDFNDIYEVLGSSNGVGYTRLWKVPRGRGGSYLTTRLSSWLDTTGATRFLRVRAVSGNRPHAVAGLRLNLEPTKIQHEWLILVVWGLWLVLWSISSVRAGGWAQGLLTRWGEADALIAAVLVVAVVLPVPLQTLLIAVAVAVVWLGLRLVSWWGSRSPFSLYVVVTVAVVLFWSVPRVFEKVLVARVAELHDLTVDHRPMPGPEINSDRIRFLGEATDLSDNEFVVMFLGDSYTYGLELEYEQAYPYVFEGLVAELDCSQPVRAVNAGWTSASPLLALRLMREIGYKYDPDLVIYNLDMTDFHDDLDYEARLRQGGDLEIDLREAGAILLARRFPAVMRHLADSDRAREFFRSREDYGMPVGADEVPEDRFFITSQPIEESVRHIERGVMKNLDELHRFVSETLNSQMTLVVYPRAYQYSSRESPRNWEAHLYEALGPYVREPFDYFAAIEEQLPFPVLRLLEAFERTDTFPLFLTDDPHWNSVGARFVATAVRDWATESGLLPCSAAVGSNPN